MSHLRPVLSLGLRLSGEWPRILVVDKLETHSARYGIGFHKPGRNPFA